MAGRTKKPKEPKGGPATREPRERDSLAPLAADDPAVDFVPDAVAVEVDKTEWLLRADEKAAISKLAKAGEAGYPEVRYLVQLYYTLQRQREQAHLRRKAFDKDARPHTLVDWVYDRESRSERAVAAMLDRYTKEEESGLGEWMRAHVGIGPIIAAGLLAHIVIDKDNCHRCHTPMAGHDDTEHKADSSLTSVSKVWRFAGLDPTSEWTSGNRRPWNAQLKTLCWKLGMSFRWFHNHADAFYGRLYEGKKAWYAAKNERGEFGRAAALKLTRFKIGKDTEAYGYYSTGKLPPAHIDAMARRYAVKVFLSNLWEQQWRRKYKTEPRSPWIIAHGGHQDHITFDPYSTGKSKPKVRKAA